MIASHSPEQTFAPHGSGRLARILLGVSVFSGLTVGLGMTATHLLDPGCTGSTPAKLPTVAVVPQGAEKIRSASVAAFVPHALAMPRPVRRAPAAEPKTARLLPGPSAAAKSQPLSLDAFNRRFVTSAMAPSAASALTKPQRFASHLLASPQPGDVRTAFAARDASAFQSATGFRLSQMAAAAPAEAPAATAAAETPAGNVLLASATPDDLPHALDLEPTPAIRLPEAPAKPDPRSAGRKLQKPATAEIAVEAPDEVPEDAAPKPALRPGKSAKAPAKASPKAPTVVASLPSKPEAPAKRKTLWQALGFAKPDNPEEGAASNIPWPGGSKKVAYYDISAQRVYLPNGTSMEAHSGQGKWRDNPAYADMKMRGPTPPSTYKLSMRETRFHGVEALRLTPVNGVNPHGRVGLLTHSYLRRRPGDSAGCIAFKDYPRFLAAFKRGDVNQVVVVSSMGKNRAPATRVASAGSSGPSVSGSR